MTKPSPSTTSNSLRPNKRLQQRKNFMQTNYKLRKTRRQRVSKLLKLLSLLLPIVLTACATPSGPLAVVCPQPPSMPYAFQPLPSELYSQTALDAIKAWQKSLTGM